MTNKHKAANTHFEFISLDSLDAGDPGHSMSPVTPDSHHWLLDVCDDLKEYCDQHQLLSASEKLQEVIKAVKSDTD